MEVILSYLDNMFLNMPKNPEVLRVKEELASMMEDKYNELISEGKKENEAVGIVISEFGDLGELADELKLRIGGKDSCDSSKEFSEEDIFGQEYTGEKSFGASEDLEVEIHFVSREEGEVYIEKSEKSSRWIGFGVLLCICCPIPIIFLGGVDESVRQLSDLSMALFGVFPLFALIAIAVGIFIYQNFQIEKYDYMKKKKLIIDRSLEDILSAREDGERTSAMWKIIVGVMLYIFSVIIVVVSASITDDAVLASLSVDCMLLCIGIATFLVITGNEQIKCIRILHQEGEFEKHRKEHSKIKDMIKSVYWMCVTAIYLGYSFLTFDWGRTWIIWPIAGMLVGVLDGIVNVINEIIRKKG